MASEAGRHNLLSYLEELPRFGKREAYLWREGVRWRRLTYRVLHRRALGCAKTLAEMGLEPGGAVLIEGPDSGHWVEALLGTLRAGGIAVPLGTGSSGEFRAKVAEDLRARLMVAPPGVEPPVGSAAPRFRLLRILFPFLRLKLHERS